jgi:hypothetical protein
METSMRIVCERDALARELGQLRFGDPQTPLLLRPDRAEDGMHRIETYVVGEIVGGFSAAVWRQAKILGLPNWRKIGSRRAIHEARPVQEKSRLRRHPQSGFVKFDSSD